MPTPKGYAFIGESRYPIVDVQLIPGGFKVFIEATLKEALKPGALVFLETVHQLPVITAMSTHAAPAGVPITLTVELRPAETLTENAAEEIRELEEMLDDDAT